MPKNFKQYGLLVWIFLVVTSCSEQKNKADLIIENAVIWTGNMEHIQAEAMAIRGDSILAIGSNDDIRKYKGEHTEVKNMAGKFVSPGFIDAHVHLMMGGNALLSVELRDAATREEFIKRIADYAKTLEPGSWILEGNWDHTLWGGELPRKEWIDQFTGKNPVVLYRLDGHMALANSLALEIAGINEDTPDIEGGEIVRDEKGFPTGILKDNAMSGLLNKIPPMTVPQKEKALKAAMAYLVSNGVTSVHDVDSIGTYPIAKKLMDSNELVIRMYTLNPLNNWDTRDPTIRTNDKWLRTGGLKGFMDGSLGSHTAVFVDDYSDKPSVKGFFINDKEDLYQWILKADNADLQVAIHAIGDNANHTLLNIFEKVIENNGPKNRRFRVEHAQHLLKEDIERFSKLGIVVSVQPYHAIDDGRWAEKAIGPDRIKTTYAFKSLLDANVTLAFGSDWPVAPASPLYGIYAAVTRRTLDGANPNGWVPSEKIAVEQALLAYTRDAAYSSFDENRKGTLEIGKLADFVVLDGDVRSIDPVDIPKIKVLQTYVGGKLVYTRN